MAAPSIALVAALGVLVADATIELGFITSMVSWLHSGAPSGTYELVRPSDSSSGSYRLAGKPLNELGDQGHASNGAAGTAIVLIGLVGALALAARVFANKRPSSAARGLYYFWLGLQVPALLLTTASLAYVFVVTNRHRGQSIDQAVAMQLDSDATAAGSRPAAYPLDTWTPQNWFAAVTSQLTFVDPDVRHDLVRHLRIMRGWQYNLIPLFVVQLVETVLAFVDFRRWRQSPRQASLADSKA